MWPLFFAVACGLANIAVGWSIKGAQNAGCRTARFGCWGNGCALVLSLAFLPFFSGPCGVGGVWLIGIVMGCLFYVVLQVNVLANVTGPPSIAWSMANMGLLVPIVLAWMLGESFQWSDAVMLPVFGAMLLAFRRGMAKADDAIKIRPWRYAVLMAVVFLGNGLLMFCFKWDQMFFPAANKACLLAAMYGSAFLLFSLHRVLTRRSDRSGPPAMKWGLMLGAAIGITQILMQAAMGLPAVIVFPLVQGLSLLGGVLLLSLIYREKFNWGKMIGVCCGLAVIVLSILRNSNN